MPAHNDFAKLKDILFGHENALLLDLRRIVAEHELRFGSREGLCQSVAVILADALKAAGVQDRQGLALAMAPAIIDGLRIEIRNSPQQIVDTFFPVTAPLASAYAASTFRDFMEGMGRRIESVLTGRFLRLGFISHFTGTPYSELLSRESGTFRFQDVILIDAESSTLLGRLPLPDAEGHETPPEEDTAGLAAALAAASRAFAQALDAGNRELHIASVGKSKVYSRAAGKYLLAVRAAGPGSRSLLKALDAAILSTLETYGPQIQSASPEEAGGIQHQAILSLAEKLPQSPPQRRKAIFAYAFFALLLAGITAWASWCEWERLEAQRIYREAVAAVQAQPGVAGYPVTVSYDPERPALAVSGLLPTRALKQELEAGIKAKLPGIPLESTLLAMPDSVRTEELERQVAQASALAAQLSGEREKLMARLEELAQGRDQAMSRLALLEKERGQAPAAVRPGNPDEGRAQAAGLDEAQAARLAARLDSFDQWRAQIDARLGDPGRRQAQAAAGAAGADDAQAARLNARLDGLDQWRAEIAAKLGNLDQWQAQANSRLGSLEQGIALASGRYDSLAEALAQANAHPGTPEQWQAQANARLGALDQAQAQANARLGSLEQGQSQIVTRLGGLDQARSQMAAQLASIADGQAQLRALPALAGQAPGGETSARLSGLDKALATLSSSLAEQRAALSGAVQESPSQEWRLARWAARNAIFFGEQTQLRNPDGARKQLAELKDLLAATSVRLRLIGYTDPLGDPGNNNRLALERARAIAEELLRLGVPANRLILAGRAKEGLIASDQGPASANRRVEFQLAYVNE